MTPIEWQPIKTAPKGAEWVLLAYRDGSVSSGSWSHVYSHKVQKAWVGDYISDQSPIPRPTHWAWPPKPPNVPAA